jgi:hypothetical protein
MNRPLKLVPPAPGQPLKPLDPKDAEHWAKVHVAGDRAKPLPSWWGKK